MDRDRIKYLLEQYAANKASKEEVAELFALMELAETDEALHQLITEAPKNKEDEIYLPQQDWDRMWSVIKSATTQRPHKQALFSMAWVRIAAAVIICIITSAVYFFYNKKNETATTTAMNNHYKNDVAAGGNKAILTLADGSEIALDAVHNGSLAQQGNTMIIKTGEGQLAYNANGKSSGSILFNTITTPVGGEYTVVLPDGSKVWLNAASSLHFPAFFSGRQRNVELTGEAYFEVAKNAAMPFHVKVNSMDVQVLGTHFNIMAYPEEKTINTTLLEGKVKVTQDGKIQNLEPGMQAIVDRQTHNIKVAGANIDQSIAWKNGVFRFKETSIKELMHEVERWYNVEVEYRTEGNDQDYTGIVPRTQNVSALLQTLEYTGTVHFEVEKSDKPGKAGKVIVLP